MGKVTYTDNLELTQYGVTFPPVYKDYTEDMSKLDAGWKGHDDRIVAVENKTTQHDTDIDNLEDCCEDVNTTLTSYGGRLDAIEEVIETVSTQNIRDLQDRLLAVEVKVDNNANAILALTNNYNELSGRVNENNLHILALRRDLTTAQNDIEYLKQCCDNVRTTLTEHAESIANNALAIQNIDTEIERMKANIAGNTQDIATLATQNQVLIESKQDKLIAGAGITIEGNVISAQGSGLVGTYSNENLALS